MNVKLLDLSQQYKGMRSEVLKAVREVCDTQSFILGSHVKGLEEEVADFCNVKHAVGVASGSDALLLSLMAIGVGPGDRVLTTPYTFFATASAIVRLGATPVFIDIDRESYNIDPDGIEEYLRKAARRTSLRKSLKAIIPVHLFGQCADMSPILALARQYGLKVVEDAAQSIGSEYRGKRAGAIGDTGCLSFYPSKNLGGFGDGGMVLTNKKGLAERLRILRVHGCKKKYYHQYIGVNSRLDEIQAAVLRLKLTRLTGWEEGRIANASRYDRLFKAVGLTDIVTLPVIHPGNHSIFNQYVLRVKKRDALRAHLAAKGIGSEIYYPVPLHLQQCFREFGYKRGSLPVSERAARETIALPIYPELKAKEQRYVVETIGEFYG
ncbi:MAG: DegT/DnrJ/EryC1/StrS family aminotransferase [Thermodesulfobacteriota bacterium]